MEKKEFIDINFSQTPRMPKIPKRFIGQAVLMISFRVVWGVIAFQSQFWVAMGIVSLLGWMASYGWKQALREFQTWINRISVE